MSEINEYDCAWPIVRWPTVLSAVDEHTDWSDPFAERPFVPVPKGCWRVAGDLGRYFRSRTPVVVVGRMSLTEESLLRTRTLTLTAARACLGGRPLGIRPTHVWWP